MAIRKSDSKAQRRAARTAKRDSSGKYTPSNISRRTGSGSSNRNPADVRAGIDASTRDMSQSGQTTGNEKQKQLAKAYASAVASGDKRGAELAALAYANETRSQVAEINAEQSQRYEEAATKAIEGTATKTDYQTMARLSGKSIRTVQQEQASLTAVQSGSTRAGDVVRTSRLLSPGRPEKSIAEISQAQQTPQTAKKWVHPNSWG